MKFSCLISAFQTLMNKQIQHDLVKDVNILEFIKYIVLSQRELEQTDALFSDVFARMTRVDI